jgi:mRNA interferase YafQ
MKKILFQKKFRKDINKLKKSGDKDINTLKDVIKILVQGNPLPIKFKDHPLKGEFYGCRDCHIEGDWILIYEVKDDNIYFYRTGSHSELFG